MVFPASEGFFDSESITCTGVLYFSRGDHAHKLSFVAGTLRHIQLLPLVWTSIPLLFKTLHGQIKGMIIFMHPLMSATQYLYQCLPSVLETERTKILESHYLLATVYISWLEVFSFSNTFIRGMPWYSFILMEDNKISTERWQVRYSYQHDKHSWMLVCIFYLIFITIDCYTNQACEQKGTGTLIIQFYPHWKITYSYQIVCLFSGSPG